MKLKKRKDETPFFIDYGKECCQGMASQVINDPKMYQEMLKVVERKQSKGWFVKGKKMSGF